MLGEIRLQWWRDSVMTGAGGGHPVATALNATVAKFHLPKDAFQRLIDARLFDLYDDPMPSLNDLEGYAGETSSALIQLAAIILAEGHDPGTDFTFGMFDGKPRITANENKMWIDAPTKEIGQMIIDLWSTRATPATRTS